MSTHVFDETHDATIRPSVEIAPGQYECTIHIGLKNGKLTKSTFVGVGGSEKEAEINAIEIGKTAILSESIEY